MPAGADKVRVVGGKIPVGKVIGQTYRLSFGRYGALLGTVWLPVLLLAAVAYLALIPAMQSFGNLVQYQIQHPHGPAPGQIPGFGLFALSELLFLTAYVWMGVGVAKEAMGLRTGSRFFYLPGADELRVVGTFIVVFIIFYAVVIAAMLVIGLVALIGFLILGGSEATFDPLSQGGLASVSFISFLVAFELGFFYVLVRMTHLVVPVTIAERHILITRSWALMRGNVLRAVAVLIVTILPVFVLELVLAGAFIIPLIAQLSALPPGTQPDPALFEKIAQDAQHYLPICGLIVFAIAPVVAGLIASPAAFAYRALVPAKPPEAQPPA